MIQLGSLWQQTHEEEKEQGHCTQRYEKGRGGGGGGGRREGGREREEVNQVEFYLSIRTQISCHFLQYLPLHDLKIKIERAGQTRNREQKIMPLDSAKLPLEFHANQVDPQQYLFEGVRLTLRMFMVIPNVTSSRKTEHSFTIHKACKHMNYYL